jgi:hypothetical protein
MKEMGAPLIVIAATKAKFVTALSIRSRNAKGGSRVVPLRSGGNLVLPGKWIKSQTRSVANAREYAMQLF